jgi:transposase
MAGISMAEIAKRLRAGISAIELAIRRKNSEEGQ